ncbi:MFS transporter [Nonomuraea sp. SMC257]|uniref:MFS transporter n=1 Tax=Nonomuraea montanisoli TaxID=2741721 RepID=A0A7Y6II39_9ACTN|nr:MFS transporter [Nonomuraea montanisoli]NUW38436.1 MFS transporter [Nonomuraea montanisoli]
MWRRFTSFDRGVRLLMVNQLAINTGFYMLMPYLAGHLSGGLGMAAWTVGLVLGVRNLSQQGLFLLGGALADRLGYRPVIIAGCLLRTVAFALLGVADALPALLAASAMTGFAGALFNPAVRAYLAHDSGERRVEAFALFNVFYQSGILAGPVIGLALVSVDFRLVCAVAAAVFGLLTLLQLLALPPCRARTTGGAGVAAGWRAVVANRPFLLFSTAMAGSSVLSFQVYLALPLLLGDAGAVGSLFVVSALVAIAGQLRITDWARRRWSGPQAVVRGLALMAIAFLPLVPAGAAPSAAARIAAVLACAALLAAGTALTYPFEMDTVVALSGERLVATHYGLYNTVAGIGITLGNLLVGALLGAGSPAAAGTALFLLGAACAVAVGALGRTGRLTGAAAPEAAGQR